MPRYTITNHLEPLLLTVDNSIVSFDVANTGWSVSLKDVAAIRAFVSGEINKLSCGLEESYLVRTDDKHVVVHFDSISFRVSGVSLTSLYETLMETASAIEPPAIARVEKLKAQEERNARLKAEREEQDREQERVRKEHEERMSKMDEDLRIRNEEEARAFQEYLDKTVLETSARIDAAAT